MTPDQPAKTGILFASIVVALVLGVYLCGALGISPTQSQARGAVLGLPVAFLGNPTQDYNGWLLPSDVLISTTFVANQSLNTFVGATVNVFPYEVEKGGTLYLGLYINGEQVSNASYSLPQSTAVPAGMLNTSLTSQSYATFTPALEGYTVNLLFMKNPLPIGTKVTITIYDTGSIWVRTASSGIPSYESPTSEPIPQSVTSIGQLQVTPYVLNIQVESDTS